MKAEVDASGLHHQLLAVKRKRKKAVDVSLNSQLLLLQSLRFTIFGILYLGYKSHLFFVHSMSVVGKRRKSISVLIFFLCPIDYLPRQKEPNILSSISSLSKGRVIDAIAWMA